MNQKVTCFLPCRKGSERVPNKNIKKFSTYRNGLIELKLRQLIDCREIDSIILSTNDEKILEYASGINSEKLTIHKRIESLSSSATSTDDLILHASELIEEGHILWTHVTSPFVTSSHYKKLIEAYFECIESGCDSLMTTTPVHSFIWNKKEPINYNREKEKWPRTQTLNPLHEVNSAAFIISAELCRKREDRIGEAPLLYPLDKITSHDIDWPEDFTIAECLAEKGLVSL